MKIGMYKISGVGGLLKAAIPILIAVVMPVFTDARLQPIKSIRTLFGYSALSDDELTGAVWDLCGREEMGAGLARVYVSGMVYSEYLPGDVNTPARSDFFIMCRDTLLWTGYNVGRRLGVLADGPVSLAAGLNTLGCVQYSASGRLDVLTPVVEHGTMEWTVVGRGKAITSPGDTISNVLLARLTVTRDSICEEEQTDVQRERVTYRWYAPGQKMPLAIQIGDALFVDASATSSATDEDAMDADKERIRSLIDAATVRYEHGRVIVTLPAQVQLHAYIMDVPGNIYSSISGCGNEFALNTSGLPHNRYILTLIAEPEAIYTRKIILNL